MKKGDRHSLQRMSGGSMQFTKATKTNAKLRLVLQGPAGSGKTYSSLRIATALSHRVALIDTEHRTASKYAGEFSFDTVNLESYSPEMYISAIEAAEKGGYEVLIIDSLSHAWAGKDGALEMADREKTRSKSHNGFAAWSKVTPVWQKMMDRILSSKLHIIGTMRSKTDYVVETNHQGKMEVRKVGLAPVFREGSDFEFDIVGELNLDHTLVISKARCKVLDGAVIEKPGSALAAILSDWLREEMEDERVNQNTDTEAPKGNVQQLPIKGSITLEIEHLGREIYYDMWSEQSEKIAQWASKKRTRGIAELTNEEKEAVLSGLQLKMKEAA